MKVWVAALWWSVCFPTILVFAMYGLLGWLEMMGIPACRLVGP